MLAKTQDEIIKNWGDNISKPVVSICCITFMHEKYIEQALDSFLAQETSFPFEIIVRDDCSTDNTINIIENYAIKYPKIVKTIFKKENTHSKGIKPFNETFKKAKGKYIALCEGDDYWIDNLKIQKQFNILESNTDIKGVHTKISYVDKDNNLLGVSDRVKKGFEIIDYKYLAQQNTIHTCSLMFVKDVIDNDLYEMLNKSPVGDLVIFLKISLMGKIAYIDKNMSAYRKGVGIMQTWSYEKNLEHTIEVYDVFESKYSFISKITELSKIYYCIRLARIYSKQEKYLLSFSCFFRAVKLKIYNVFNLENRVNNVSLGFFIKTFIKLILNSRIK